MVTSLVVLSPFGVFPMRSGGHAAVLHPARELARRGIDVHLFGMGLRRFEAWRHFRSFIRELEPGLVEQRMISLYQWLDYLRRGRTGRPPVGSGDHLRRKAPRLLREKCHEASAIVYESPWLFPFDPGNRPRLLVCHNVESDLVAACPHATSADRERALAIEGQAYREASSVLCFTEEDRSRLSSLFGPRETAVIPIGVDGTTCRPPLPAQRESARRELGIEGRFVVLFTGSWHIPNRKALELVVEWARLLKPGSKVLYVVAGSVEGRPRRTENLVVSGPVADLRPWFRAADLFVHPVQEGSGANVKLLEALAFGLPVVTTPFGARGIPESGREHLVVREVEKMPAAIEELRGELGTLADLSARGRAWVEGERSWAILARRRLEMLEQRPARGAASPFDRQPSTIS
jgi:glycosyltransferase involved in cell wall biosynthesis